MASCATSVASRCPCPLLVAWIVAFSSIDKSIRLGPIPNCQLPPDSHFLVQLQFHSGGNSSLNPSYLFGFALCPLEIPSSFIPCFHLRGSRLYLPSVCSSEWRRTNHNKDSVNVFFAFSRCSTKVSVFTSPSFPLDLGFSTVLEKFRSQPKTIQPSRYTPISHP